MDGQNGLSEQLTEQQAQEELVHLRRLFSRVRLLRKDVLENLAARCRANVPSDCFFSNDPQGMCDHCVSACAYRDRAVRNKLETVGDTVWQCMAKYVVVDGEPCVIEMATELDQDFLNSFSGRGRLLDQLTFYHDKIYTDVLTGVYNRRYYEEQIRDTNLYAGIAMMDADDFKLYNDLYGHNVGDAVLRTMVNAISGCLRKSDMLIRYGGDEFLLIIPSVSSDSFLNVLNRIRQRVSNAEVSGFPRIHLSVSIGAVECKNEPVEQAVRRADEIMLLAKSKKNRICTERGSFRQRTDGRSADHPFGRRFQTQPRNSERHAAQGFPNFGGRRCGFLHCGAEAIRHQYFPGALGYCHARKKRL